MEQGLIEDREVVPLRTLGRVASVATGIQFGWALQLSLLVPYVQLLGISHQFASLIWLCGPISGMVVQPIVGYCSDRSECSWGRRRPFMVVGSACITAAVLLIGFSADIGYALGDSVSHRPRAIVVFVCGFWLLDLSNNVQQGPSRALLADLSGKRIRWMRCANGFFSFFMAVGNVLGYAAGSYSGWHNIFTFTKTKACDVSCANLKSAFFIAIVILIITTTLSVTATTERSSSQAVTYQGISSDDSGTNNDGASISDNEKFSWNFVKAFRNLPIDMKYVLLVTALTWIAWFPFQLFDTDWMGREVYGGESYGSPSILTLYDKGVRAGAFGLMLNAIIQGVTSLLIDFLSRKMGNKILWAVSNFILCISLACMIIITYLAGTYRQKDLTTPTSLKILALVLFAILGAPLAVTYSLPFAIAAAITSRSEAGQGLSMGVLNLAIVFPQMLVSIGSGPLDQLLGGGNNVPAFSVASFSALIGAVVAFVFLRSSPPSPAH